MQSVWRKKPQHQHAPRKREYALVYLTVLIGFCVQIKFYNRHKFDGTWWTKFLSASFWSKAKTLNERNERREREREKSNTKKRNNNNTTKIPLNLFVHVSQIEICVKQMQHFMRLWITSVTIIQANDKERKDDKCSSVPSSKVFWRLNNTQTNI